MYSVQRVSNQVMKVGFCFVIFGDFLILQARELSNYVRHFSPNTFGTTLYFTLPCDCIKHFLKMKYVIEFSRQNILKIYKDIGRGGCHSSSIRVKAHLMLSFCTKTAVFAVFTFVGSFTYYTEYLQQMLFS